MLRLLDFMTPVRPQIEQMSLGCCKVSKGQTVNSELLLSLLDCRASKNHPLIFKLTALHLFPNFFCLCDVESVGS